MFYQMRFFRVENNLKDNLFRRDIAACIRDQFTHDASVASTSLFYELLGGRLHR